MTSYIPSLTLPEQFFARPAIAVLLPLVTGFASGYFIRNVERDYASWKKPRFYPPPWVFGPVWTVLYMSMGGASYYAWTTGMASINPSTVQLTKHGATLYTIHLGLLQLYMPLFFGVKKPITATVLLAGVVGMVAYLMSIWSQVDSRSVYLLAPYLAWISFATYLSTAIGYLNNWNLSAPTSTKQS